MFRNYILSSFRYLKKNKIYTLINIFGLTLCVTTALLIFFIIEYELGFDKQQQNADKIYRVVTHRHQPNGINYVSGIPYPFAAAFKNEFPEIKYASFVDGNFGAPLVKIEKKDGAVNRFTEGEAVYVEPAYFKMFNYTWLHGSADNVLLNPNGIVITEELAKKYFDTDDAVGRTILVNDDRELVVEGVVANTGEQSSLPFNFFMAFNKDRGNDNWSSISSAVQFYILFESPNRQQHTAGLLNEFADKYLSDEDKEELEFLFQPLAQIHFDERYFNFGVGTASFSTLYILGAIAFLIILLSAINFINLNTALAMNRTNEVGIRKVFGSKRSDLIIRFFIETFFVTLISFIIGIILVTQLYPFVERLTGYSVNINSIEPGKLILFITATFAMLSLLAGIYPSLILSRYNPVNALKNKFNSSGKSFSLRKALVVFQFGVSQAIVVAAIIALNQLSYISSSDLGFKKESVLEINLPVRDQVTLQTLKSELLKSPIIENVTFSNTGTSSSNVWTGDYSIVGNTEFSSNAQVKFADTDYLKTFKLKLIAGSDFIDGISDQLIINEALAKEIGNGNDFRSAIGKQLKIWNVEAPIVGIVKNFVTTSLHEKVKPTIISHSESSRLVQGAARINTSNYTAAVKEIKVIWEKVFPGKIFDFSFLDEEISRKYQGDKNLANMLNSFSVISLLIGCLGLFGLVSFMIERKAKEIGIRKVLGATILDIMLIFNIEYLIMILAGFIIFTPLSYFVMNGWLSSFAYRINISPYTFAIVLLLTLILALVTISLRVLKSALSNPVKSLRYE